MELSLGEGERFCWRPNEGLSLMRVSARATFPNLHAPGRCSWGITWLGYHLARASPGWGITWLGHHLARASPGWGI